MTNPAAKRNGAQLATCVAACLALGLTVLATLAHPARAGEASAPVSTTGVGAGAATYNFAYKIAGDRTIAPIQAFDNGTRLWMQFRDMTAIPALFADTPAGRRLLRQGADFDLEPPFVVLRRIEPELVLTVRKRQAFVSLNAARPGQVVQTPAMYGAAKPSSVAGAVPAPVEGRAGAAHGGIAPSAVAAADVSTPPAIAAAAQTAPVLESTDPASGSPTTPPATSPSTSWTLVGGKTIRPQLLEWAGKANWHLDWKLGIDWVVPSNVSYEGTFDSALTTVVQQLYAQGKPVRLNIWTGNHVVEVVNNDVK